MKLLCISLGCDKNLVDAERMLGSLSQDGYTFTDDICLLLVISKRVPVLAQRTQHTLCINQVFIAAKGYTK